MNGFLLVGAGGALGAMARFGFSSLIGRLWPMGFPLATLLINIIGSIAMGLFVGLMAKLLPANQEELRLFVAVGIFGGFTTFSSFSLDTIVLIERGELFQAITYVALSVVVCLIGLYLGLLITRGSPA
ncbi:fluoride efflux transporter CrcB [Devosia sp. LjRoot3]|uniref:fluoride efflux transporter CrcB n=1 Tax=Devosia sp. LjRoot3 TaxID=3342319 RepID=UPI003ED0FB42